MARKEVTTKNDILETAFTMLREEGELEVTARKLAAKVGCSTQPIFRVYKNMEELYDELFTKAVLYFDGFYHNCKKENEVPFVDLGMAYIHFAMEEKQLFRYLFLNSNRHDRTLYEILNGSMGAVSSEIKKASADGCKNSQEMFMKMWIFIHGAACMSLTDDYDLDMEATKQLLKDSYQAYLATK